MLKSIFSLLSCDISSNSLLYITEAAASESFPISIYPAIKEVEWSWQNMTLYLLMHFSPKQSLILVLEEKTNLPSAHCCNIAQKVYLCFALNILFSANYLKPFAKKVNKQLIKSKQTAD